MPQTPARKVSGMNMEDTTVRTRMISLVRIPTEERYMSIFAVATSR